MQNAPGGALDITGKTDPAILKALGQGQLQQAEAYQNGNTQQPVEADPVKALLDVMYGVRDQGQQLGGQMGNSLQNTGNALYNFGNEAIDRAGHILSQAGPITQPFGNYNPSVEKYSGGVNYGTDIGVGTGTKVALPEGRWHILESNATGSMNSGYGNSIYAQNLETGEKLRMSHLSKVGVQKGDIVSGGRVIGETGATGNTTGPHLDLEYYNNQGKLADVMNSPYAPHI